MIFNKKINYLLLFIIISFSCSLNVKAMANDINYEITSFDVSDNGKINMVGWSFVDHADNYGGKNLTTWIIAYRGKWNSKWSNPKNCNKAYNKKKKRLCKAFKTEPSRISGEVEDAYFMRCVGGACKPSIRDHYRKLLKKNINRAVEDSCTSSDGYAPNSHCTYYNVGFKLNIDINKDLLDEKEFGEGIKLNFKIVSDVVIKKKTIRRCVGLGFITSTCKINGKKCKVGKSYKVLSLSSTTTSTEGNVTTETKEKKNYYLTVGGLNDSVNFTAISARRFSRETGYSVRGGHFSTGRTYEVKKVGRRREYNNYKGNEQGKFFARRFKLSRDGESDAWAWTAWVEATGKLTLTFKGKTSTKEEKVCDEYCIGGLCDSEEKDNICHEVPEELDNPSNYSDSHNECTDADFSTINEDGEPTKVQVNETYYYRMGKKEADEYFKNANTDNFVISDADEEPGDSEDSGTADDFEEDQNSYEDDDSDTAEIDSDEKFADYDDESTELPIDNTDETEKSADTGVSVFLDSSIWTDDSYYYFPVTLQTLIEIEQTGKFRIVKGGGSQGSGVKFINNSLTIPAGGYFNYAFDYTVSAKWKNGNFVSNGKTGTSPYNTYLSEIEIPLKNSDGSTLKVYVSLKNDSDYLYNRNGSRFLYNLDLYKKVAQEKMNSILKNGISDNLNVNVAFPNSNNVNNTSLETKAGSLRPNQTNSIPNSWEPNRAITLNYRYEINKAYGKNSGANYSYYSYDPSKASDPNYTASKNNSVYYVPVNMDTSKDLSVDRDKKTWFNFTVDSDSLSLWSDVSFGYHATCSVKVVNTLKPPPGGNGSPNLSYRTIDVNDPFPSTLNRIGSNWKNINFEKNVTRIKETFSDFDKYYYQTKKALTGNEFGDLSSFDYSSFEDVFSNGNSSFVTESNFDRINRKHCSTGTYSTECDRYYNK